MSSGGGNTQVTTEKPYEPSEPYLKDIMREAENIYESDVGKSYFPNSTVVPFADDTTRALNLQRARSYDLMSPSNIYGTAADTLTGAATGAMGDSYGGPMLGAGMGNAYTGRMGIGLGDSYAGGPAYNQLGTSSGQYLADVRSSIGADVMGQIGSQFGSMGRTGTSPGAQAAATRAFTQQYAPIAQSAAESERQRQLGSYEADLNRFQQAREGALGRTQEAIQADIARQQTGREAALARRMAGAAGLPGVQGAMDARFNMGISGLGGVGSAYEDLAGRQLQDQIARYDYQQQSPYMRLQQYASLINPIAGRGTSQYQTGPSANPLMSGLTGAYLGSQAFPGNPYATAIGAFGGLLG